MVVFFQLRCGGNFRRWRNHFKIYHPSFLLQCITASMNSCVFPVCYDFELVLGDQHPFRRHAIFPPSEPKHFPPISPLDAPAYPLGVSPLLRVHPCFGRKGFDRPAAPQRAGAVSLSPEPTASCASTSQLLIPHQNGGFGGHSDGRIFCAGGITSSRGWHGGQCLS